VNLLLLESFHEALTFGVVPPAALAKAP
jgi:hypothetical protein